MVYYQFQPDLFPTQINSNPFNSNPNQLQPNQYQPELIPNGSIPPV